MKSYYLITLLFISFFTQAQIVNIPDANFKNALVNENVVDIDGDEIGDIPVDTNNDGEIQESEAESVESLIVSGFEINSLEGISSFTNLLGLWCDNNLLSELDITLNTSLQGLYCNSNNLVALDITQNINLSFLWCFSNMINSLDTSQNLNLIHLNCKQNNISELDISQNLNLSTLNCPFNNLTELDVTQNAGLRTLGITGNNISEIDLTQNQEILFFTCAANNFTELDLSQNHNLYWFQCHFNENLEFLDLRNGGNNGLSLMWAHDTPNLRCILVDNGTFANSQACGFPTSGWCKDANDIYIETMADCVLKIEDNPSINFTIYPNPTQNILFIETQQQIETVKIYNLQGQLIVEVPESRVDVSTLSTGLYFVQVRINGKSETKKFVKE